GAATGGTFGQGGRPFTGGGGAGGLFGQGGRAITGGGGAGGLLIRGGGGRRAAWAARPAGASPPAASPPQTAVPPTRPPAPTTAAPASSCSDPDGLTGVSQAAIRCAGAHGRHPGRGAHAALLVLREAAGLAR